MTYTMDTNGTLCHDPVWAMFEVGKLCDEKLKEFADIKHEWLGEVLLQAESLCSDKRVTRPFPVTPNKRKRRAKKSKDEHSPFAKRRSKSDLVASFTNEEAPKTAGSRRTTRACKNRAESKIHQKLEATSTSRTTVSEVPDTQTDVLDCSKPSTEESGVTYLTESKNSMTNAVNGDCLVDSSEAIQSVSVNETDCGKQLDKQNSFVKQQVKVLEEKICTDLLETPRKAKRTLDCVLETSNIVEANRLSIGSTDHSEKSYVSVLTPLTLSAKKKMFSAIVLCSPLKPVTAISEETEKTMSPKGSHGFTNVHCTKRLSSRLSTATYSLRSILPPSKRRTSVLLSKIRKSMEQKRRSSNKNAKLRASLVNSNESKNSTEIEEKSSDLDSSGDCKENLQPTNPKTPEEGSSTDEKCTPVGTDSLEDDKDYDDDVIETTPSPKCPKNKAIFTKQYSAKKGGMITRSLRRVAGQTSENRARVSGIRKKSFTPSGKRTPMTPMSANWGNKPFTPNRFPFGRSNYQSPMAQELHLREQQKLKEILKKEAKEKEILRIRQEKLKKKLDEQKSKRDARMQRALEKRRQKERELLETQQRLEQEQEERLMAKERQRDEKLRLESLKKSQYKKQKAAEVSARRKLEEEARLQKLKEQEEEQQRYQQMLQRKKEYEEAERIKQKQLELQRQREHEKEMRQIKEKEIAQLKEIEALKQKIAKNNEETKKLLQEREVICCPDDNEVSIISVQAADATFSKQKTQDLNSTYNKSPTEATTSMQPALNSTFNKPVTSNENYEITPERNRSVDVPLKDSNNYDISLLCSEDSTDDESQPRKQVPDWASGIKLRTALIVQNTKPLDLDELFPKFDLPDLTKIFKKKRQRFLQRTSSAIWNSPILKHCERD